MNVTMGGMQVRWRLRDPSEEELAAVREINSHIPAAAPIELAWNTGAIPLNAWLRAEAFLPHD